jgi:putative oxidoreductase
LAKRHCSTGVDVEIKATGSCFPKEFIMQRLESLNRFSPYVLAVLRIVTALIFMTHGMQKLFGFPEPPQNGLPPVLSLFWIGGMLELGGVLILIGLFTRIIAFVLSGEMAVAYWMVHAPRSFVPALNGGDAAILFCFVFLLFVFTGPGAWSLDGLLAGRRAARLGEAGNRASRHRDL